MSDTDTTMSPTYYGPVPQGQFENTQTDSSMNCMVLLPLQDYGTFPLNGDITYTERWKGPVSAMIKHPTGIKLFNVELKIGGLFPDVDPNTWIRRFPRPTLQDGFSWMIRDIRISECNPAGDHAFVDIGYKMVKNDEWDFTGESGKIQKKVTWSIEWATRNATALIYLSNKSGTLKWIKWINPKKQGKGQDVNVNDLSIYAKMAIDAMQNQTAESRIKLDKYQFVVKDGVYELPTDCLPKNKNVNPQKVVDKYIAGVSPLLHYPILKRVTSANFKHSRYQGNLPKWTTITGQTFESEDKIAVNIDTIVAFPSECPFTFDDSTDYSWIKTGDNFQTDQQNDIVVYTRTEVWWGDLIWDYEYYTDKSTKRWKIGGEKNVDGAGGGANN